MTSAALISPETLDRHTISSLPVVVLHVHSRCNCRCVMCDIWQTKETQELSPERLLTLLPDFHRLDVRWVVLTGGEPLLHRNLPGICQPLRATGIRVTLLTTGLLLEKLAPQAAELFDEVIVSLDGPPAIHDQIRRVPNGFQRITAGLRAVREMAPDLPLRARVTVQKGNFRHLREIVRLGETLPLESISFLAADLTSTAFNRELVWPTPRQNEIGISLGEIPLLENEIDLLIAEHESEIASGFISENPAKLRRIVDHFRAHAGVCPPTSPMCNAPWKSAVIELDGSLRPCFFQPRLGNAEQEGLLQALNNPRALAFRTDLDIASDAICQRCVCSLNYRA